MVILSKYMVMEGITLYGVLDHLVKKVEKSDRLQIKSIPDKNNDGIDDWKIIYPNGDRQILFQID